MKRIACLLTILLATLLLCACGRTSENGMEKLNVGDTRFLTVTLEGEGIAEASVRVFPAEKGKDGELILGEALLPTFDGIDTHLLTLPRGGNYMLEVTNAHSETARCFISLKNESVCSFLINLNRKPESSVRLLWPQTPHSSSEFD